MLRVAINAEITQVGRNGGLESVLIGLISALAGSKDADQRYTIIGPPDHPEWLRPYLGDNQEIVLRPRHRSSLRAKVRSRLAPAPSASPTIPPVSSGFYESLHCDLIHFPYQHFEITSVPAVYTPHDLQHLHYPQFFSATEIARREAMYRTGCQLARKVTVGSEWVRQDLLRNYSVDPGKVEVIPWAPPTQAYPAPSETEIAGALSRHGLKPGFALYPAVTWPHKNHVRLLEALALVRDRHGLDLDLVCTGHQSAYFSEIVAKQRSLGLDDRVKFLGVVPGKELRALYRSAGFVIVPTLFEAASGPMYEGWNDGAPVACSSVTSLPEQAGDAALIFDPFSVEAIAQALVRMHQDEDLRRDLTARGTQRLQSLSWRTTADRYRALYRRVAGLSPGSASIPG